MFLKTFSTVCKDFYRVTNGSVHDNIYVFVGDDRLIIVSNNLSNQRAFFIEVSEYGADTVESQGNLINDVC